MKAIILIGPPGSGKSTLSTSIIEANKAIKGSRKLDYHSLDKTREELFGTDDYQGGYEVFSIFSSGVRASVANRHNILIDNTSVKAKFRKNLLKMLQDYEIEYRVMMTPLKECLRRNAQRERVVPEDVLVNMHKIFEENLDKLTIEVENVYFHYPDGSCSHNKRKRC